MFLVFIGTYIGRVEAFDEDLDPRNGLIAAYQIRTYTNNQDCPLRHSVDYISRWRHVKAITYNTGEYIY